MASISGDTIVCEQDGVVHTLRKTGGVWREGARSLGVSTAQEAILAVDVGIAVDNSRAADNAAAAAVLARTRP